MNKLMPVVLLADGDAQRRARLRAMLADSCLVAEAATAEEAAAVEPDLVLCSGDFDGDGLAALAQHPPREGGSDAVPGPGG